jgi:predicted nucleotidyltransferase
MSVQLEAIREINTFLTKRKIPYVLIGGIAVQFWGEARFTKDVDITVSIPIEDTDEFVREISNNFKLRVKDIIEFVNETRVLPIFAKNGCEIDISLALPGYEDYVMDRSQIIEIEKGNSVRICSAEDLIIHKAVAGRQRDLEDIKGIIFRNGDSIEIEYIREWLKEFSLILETDEVLNRFENYLKEYINFK